MILDLSTIGSAWSDGSSVGEIWHAGERNWVRPIAFSDLYGTGMGQVPIDISPADAVLDQGGLVTSVPNRGGTGAYHNATATGSVGLSDSMLIVGAGTHIKLANLADLAGVRVFFVARPDLDADDLGVIGAEVSPVGYTAVSLYYYLHKWRWRFSSESAVIWPAYSAAFDRDIGQLALFEIEYTPSELIFAKNGSTFYSRANPTFGSFPIDMIGEAPEVASYVGGIGRIISLITDGRTEHAPLVQKIRTQIAADYGITLAGGA